MMLGDFPPNSRVTLFRFLSWAFFMMSYPTSVEPVKATLSIPGCLARWAPMSPNPDTMLTTPAGNPASLISSAILSAERGVCSAVFMTTVQPAASAGASFQACMRRGKFQGMICPTTPTGSLRVERLNGPSMAIVWPLILSTHPPQYLQHRCVRVRSAALATSTGLPLLMASMAASSPACFSTRSASLKRHLALSVGSILDQGPLSKASLAALTARSTSSVDPFCTVVRTEPSLGLMRSKVWFLREFTNLPLIKSCFTKRSLEISINYYTYLNVDLLYFQTREQQENGGNKFIDLFLSRIKYMHRSFDEVIRSGINNSKSKYAHAFPQSPRFRDTRNPCEQPYYNLNALTISAQIKRKDRCTSQQARTYIVRDVSPGPCAYNSKSFLERERKIKVGPTIAQAQRLGERLKEPLPGPGAYSPRDKKQKQLAYTMGPRLQSPLSKSLVGPGQYRTEKYNTIEGANSNKLYSKYTKVQSFKIGKEERFLSPKQFTPGPAEYIKSSHQLRQTFSFGREERNLFGSKTATPGPGAYYEFSEFAERRRQLQSNLRRMQKLVKER